MVMNADSIENAIGPPWPGGQYAYGVGGTDEPQRSPSAQSVSCGRRGSGSTDTPVRQYIWETYIDECIQSNLLVAAGPQPVPVGAYYLLQDLLYRAVALTNSGGQVVEAYDTDAYGNTLIFTAPGADGIWFTDDDAQSDYGANEIIYCGYRFDPESQLYYVRNRIYNPVLGRWIQRDPIGYDGGINLYEYLGGRPAIALDAPGTGAVGTMLGYLRDILNLGFFGTKACFNFIFPSPIPSTVVAITVCGSVDVKRCCEHGRKKICAIADITASGGIYELGSIRFGWNPPPSSWRSPISLQQIRKRHLPAKWLRVPFRHGLEWGCPNEGIQGEVCATASVGFWSWTFGVRGCLGSPGLRPRIEAGMGVGQGTGISVGGGFTITACEG